MIKKNLLRPSVLVLAGALLALGLAGCDEKKPASAQTSDVAALPLTTGPATAIVPAPAASALPAAPPVKVVHIVNPAERYAYVDRAYEMSRAIGQAPPDYGFDYEGVHPWVWRSSNREVRLIEPVDGGYRYYYYRPGAENPYLVKDPDYSYAYSDGQLVAVYDNDGRILPPDYIYRRADDAGRYLARAASLYRASVRSERRSVNAANWAARRADLDAARARWEAQQNQQDDWRSYHAQHDAEDRVYWQGERDQRDRAARSFNDWQNQGYNGPPPPPVRYDGHDDRNGQPSPGQGPGFRRGDGSRDSRDGNQYGQPPVMNDRSGDPAQQSRDDAARQAKAVADAAAQARQQQAQADAAAQAKADTARIQQKAQADAAAQARQQQAQADAAAQAKVDAARQAQAKAVADAAAQARQQQVQADAARAQQKAQADATAQAQQRAQADAARAQQKARADAAAQAKAKAAHPAPAATPPQAQTLPGTVPLTKEQADAIRAAEKKAREDARHQHEGDATPPPQQ